MAPQTRSELAMPPADALPLIRLTIDGRSVSVPAGTTIWNAARQLGIDIPVLCHQSRLQPVGVCRLCVVDVGGRVLAAACVRASEEGMSVVTGGERIERQRRMLVAMLLSEHPVPCQRECTTGDCELEALGRHHGLIEGKGTLSVVRGTWPKTTHNGRRTTDHSSPVIAVDH